MMDENVLSSLAFCFCMSLNTDIESRHLIASIELLCKNVFIKIVFINLSFHHLLQMNSEVIKNDRCQRQEEKTKKKTDSDYTKLIFLHFQVDFD